MKIKINYDFFNYSLQQALIKLCRRKKFFQQIELTSFPRILLLGANGFIGNTILRAAEDCNLRSNIIGTYNTNLLSGLKHFPVLKNGKINTDGLKEIIRQCQPEVVINATGIASPEKCKVDYSLAYNINVEFIKKLLSLLVEFRKSATLINLSSEVITKNVYKSDEYHNTNKPDQTDAYAYTKWLAEDLLYNQSQINFISLRLPLMIGTAVFQRSWDYDCIKNIIHKKKIELNIRERRRIASAMEIGYAILQLAFLIKQEKLKNLFINLPGPLPISRYDLGIIISHLFNCLPENILPKENPYISKFSEYQFTAKKIGIKLEIEPKEALALKIYEDERINWRANFDRYLLKSISHSNIVHGLENVDERIVRIYQKIFRGEVITNSDKQSIINPTKEGLEYCITYSKLKKPFQKMTLDKIIQFAPQMIVPVIASKALTNGRLRYLEPLQVPHSRNNIMIIYFLRNTWIRPHIHLAKDTYYYILSGRLAFMIFQNGDENPFPVVMEQGDFFVMRRGIKHTCMILNDHCCVISGKKGSYIPEIEKNLLNDGFPCDDQKDEEGNYHFDQVMINRIFNDWKKKL